MNNTLTGTPETNSSDVDHALARLDTETNELARAKDELIERLSPVLAQCSTTLTETNGSILPKPIPMCPLSQKIETQAQVVNSIMRALSATIERLGI